MTEGTQPEGKRPQPPKRSNSEADAGWAVLSILIAGLAFWGGIGYGLDRWFGTHYLVVVGLLVGIAAAIYLVYVRYGR